MRAHPASQLFVVLMIAPALAGCLGPADVVDDALAAGALTGAVDPTVFAKIHNPAEIAEIINSFTQLPGVDVAEIGASIEGRPLHKVVLGRGTFELWAVGRHHGNEPTGAEAILQMIPLLADPAAAPGPDAPPIVRFLHANRDAVLDRVTLVTVPLVNPDGAERFQRGNVNGVDLNREYFAFKEPEPVLVREAFWEHWPDACLDLHNEGLSERFDYDAFVPLVMMEREMEASLTAASWRTVYEVDASGGFGGGPNENYRLADDGSVLEQVVWPDAYHPGTHDMFCSVRGAPGWTPEGAIPFASGAPSEDVQAYAWSTRLHLVTLATALLDAAGLYDGFITPVMTKTAGSLSALGASHMVDVPTAGKLRLQAVWHEADVADKNALPVLMEIVTPDGQVIQGREPVPGSFTATVDLADADAGTYIVNLKGATGVRYEVRSRLVPDQAQPVAVERTVGGLRVAAGASPATIVLTDVVDAGSVDVTAIRPVPSRTALANGTVAPRFILEWDLDLGAGQVVDITVAGTNPGPWRWTATDSAMRLATGVEAARSTAAGEA